MGGIFSSCTNITDITINRSTAPSLYYSAFQGIASGGTLYVPSGSRTSYNSEWMKSNNLGSLNWTLVEQ